MTTTSIHSQRNDSRSAAGRATAIEPRATSLGNVEQLGPYWALRLGTAFCFIGHGAFGFITKAAWVPYFAVLGIPEVWAWRLMPLVGALDVTLGMMILFAPRRLPLLYMAVWGFWTALLRPLSGEPWFEAIERAGNYGVPLALLCMSGWNLRVQSWLGEVVPMRIAGFMDGAERESRLRVTQWILRGTTVAALAGHGLLGAVTQKPLFATHYAAAGLPSGMTAIIGWCEIAMAVLIAVRPMVPVLLLAFVWKVATESLFIVAGAPVWEFVERAGSYAAPLALAFIMLAVQTRRTPLATRILVTDAITSR